MTRKEIVITMMAAIAPEVIKRGLDLHMKLIDMGHEPEKCTCGGMGIPQAYAKVAREWAEALADEAINA